MSNLIDTSKALKALDVLNRMSQIKLYNNEYFSTDIQNLIYNLEQTNTHAEIIELFSTLGKKLCDEKIVNSPSNSTHFDIALDFFETHIESIRR